MSHRKRLNNDRDCALEEKNSRTPSIAIFLLVFLFHGLLIAVLMQDRKLILSRKHDTSEGLLVYLLPREWSPGRDALKPESPSKVVRRTGLLRRQLPSLSAPQASTAPIETAAPPAQIDWQHELELAVKNGVANDEAQKSYRDLSKSMSPWQADWLKQHQMEPANPGLTWKKPRVEVTKDGMPIVHINDHCVLVPLLFVPMVFCSIGHIEPNGDLFKHLRDPLTH